MENIRELTPQEVAVFIWEDELLSDDEQDDLIRHLHREIAPRDLH